VALLEKTSVQQVVASMASTSRAHGFEYGKVNDGGNLVAMN